jgi:proteic killer suppression protein
LTIDNCHFTIRHDFELQASRLAPALREDDRRGLNAENVEKIARVLARLQRAAKPEDMNLPGYRLHQLRGDTGFWSITIRANWRIVFRFEGADVKDVDYLDYH